MDIGFKPHAPVDPMQFADPTVRERWQRESGLVVLSFYDPENRRPTVDIFAEYPLDFELLFRDSVAMSLTTTPVRVASLNHLIAIKEAAGRQQDLDDVVQLIAVRDSLAP
jgi:hypothetical protein